MCKLLWEILQSKDRRFYDYITSKWCWLLMARKLLKILLIVRQFLIRSSVMYQRKDARTQDNGFTYFAAHNTSDSKRALKIKFDKMTSMILRLSAF